MVVMPLQGVFQVLQDEDVLPVLPSRLAQSGLVLVAPELLDRWGAPLGGALAALVVP